MHSCQLEQGPEAPFLFSLYHLLHESLTNCEKHLLERCVVGKTKAGKTKLSWKREGWGENMKYGIY